MRAPALLQVWFAQVLRDGIAASVAGRFVPFKDVCCFLFTNINAVASWPVLGALFALLQYRHNSRAQAGSQQPWSDACCGCRPQLHAANDIRCMLTATANMPPPIAADAVIAVDVDPLLL